MVVRVFVDFDGTIAPSDPTDSLFAAFATPAWREIEREWQQGQSTARDCMRRQTELLDVTPVELDAFLAEIKIDSGFPAFVEVCRQFDAEVMVVSDGFDRVVGSVLRHAGLDLPFRANRLLWQGGAKWRFEPKAQRADCGLALGNCKCSYQVARPGTAHVMVGDGRSDFCVASQADLVLAKGTLADHCQDELIAHVRVRDFADATRAIKMWLSQRAKVGAAKVRSGTWAGSSISTSA